MRLTRRAKIVIWVLAAMLAYGAGSAWAHSVSRWAHYTERRTGNELVVKAACLSAEDSAAHLKLIAYDDGGGHIVYGCYRRGY